MKWNQIIKEIRNKLFLTQEELAKILSVSFATINRWENGHNEPTMKAKRKIKNLCDQNHIKIS